MVNEIGQMSRTPLYDVAVAAGGRMVPFDGWEMAVQFADIKLEHRAVREDVGLFDISHMGQIAVEGAGGGDFLGGRGRGGRKKEGEEKEWREEKGRKKEGKREEEEGERKRSKKRRKRGGERGRKENKNLLLCFDSGKKH